MSLGLTGAGRNSGATSKVISDSSQDKAYQAAWKFDLREVDTDRRHLGQQRDGERARCAAKYVLQLSSPETLRVQVRMALSAEGRRCSTRGRAVIVSD